MTGTTEREKPEISLILVSYNGWSDLSECLASLQRDARGMNIEVIVVDNASRDGTPDRLAEAFPEVRLIRNPENLGYPAANNQGIRESRGELLLFLNPDTMIRPGALDRLRRELRSRPELGGAGPALLTGETAYQISFGGRVDFFSELWRKLLLNPLLRRRPRAFRIPRDVGWLSGACLLVRRAALEETGFFDESYFLYFEDIDLCYRLRDAGWGLAFVPEARVTHKGGVSTSARRVFSRYHYRRSQLIFYRKHNSGVSRLLLKVFLAFTFSARLLLSLPAGGKARAVRLEFFKLLRSGKPAPPGKVFRA